MNIQTTDAIEAATGSKVTYKTFFPTDKPVYTTYSITKPVSGKPFTVTVDVTAELTAAVPCDELAKLITAQVTKEFANARKQEDQKRRELAEAYPVAKDVQ